MAGLLAAAISLDPAASRAADFPAPLPIEKLGQVGRLPESYPANWVFLDYLVSYSLIDSKIDLVDGAAQPTAEMKGSLGANYYANFLQATARPQLYVAESFMSRGSRGERTDAITIYDKTTLTPQGEIVLPGAKRGLFLIQPNSFQFADNEKLGLVYNFTPAASVTVVDLQARKILGEVSIPGCALIYPTGPRGFSTLCASGSMLSVQLDAAGKVVKQTETKSFNTLDDDPLFSAPALVSGQNYFVSYKSKVQPIDLSGTEPKLSKPWSLVTAEEAKANWRPSGSQLVAGDDNGRLYVIMQPNGREGSHREGGSQVWVFDVATHAKVATISLKNPAQSINVSSGAQPTLLAASVAATLDSYDLATGQLKNSVPIQSGGGLTLIYPVRHASAAQ